MIIRTIREEDAENFLQLCLQLDQETQFMLFEPGERTTSAEEQRQRIQGLLSQDNKNIFVAEQAGQLAGFLGAFGGDLRRNRSCAYIVIGILQAFAGQGLGTQFFQALDEWALRQHLHRLELTVMCHNAQAVHLYKKMGFQIEGIKQDSLWVNGAYVDEFYMGKIIKENNPLISANPR
jgi:RimJ/RimL family protein N-acetyltransferase